MSNLSRGSHLQKVVEENSEAVHCQESSATEIRVNFALRDALVVKEAPLENLVIALRGHCACFCQSPSTAAAARIIEVARY